VNKLRGVAFLVWLTVLVLNVFFLPNSAMGQEVQLLPWRERCAILRGQLFLAPNRHHQLIRGFQDRSVTRQRKFCFSGASRRAVSPRSQKDGFASYQQNGIVLTVNQVAQLSVTLQLGEIKEVIQVNESTPQVDTTTGRYRY